MALSERSPLMRSCPEELVLSGPLIKTANPFAKEAKEVCKTNADYDPVDLTTLDENYIPRSKYQLNISGEKLDDKMPQLNHKPYRSFFRLVTRYMINSGNERCLFTALIPPGVSHIDTMVSFATSDKKEMCFLGGISSSLILEACLRLQNMKALLGGFNNLPVCNSFQFKDSISRRFIALNGLTKPYDPIWRESEHLGGVEDKLLLNDKKMKGYGEPYAKDTPLRDPAEREQALIEIDALTALSYGLSEEELGQVYEILFPVMLKYDRKREFNRKEKLFTAYTFFKERGW